MKITKSDLKEMIKEVIQENSDYQAFVKKALDKMGKSLGDMSDDETRDFFNKIDIAWDSKSEKNESLNEAYDKTFEKIYNKYLKKDHFGTKELINIQLNNWKKGVERGEKEAQKYSKEDVIKYVLDGEKAKAYIGFQKIKDAIERKDVAFLKDRLHHFNKMWIEFFEAITGKQIPKTTKGIRAYLDNEFQNEVVKEGYRGKFPEDIDLETTKKVAKMVAAAISKVDGVRATVNPDIDKASFDIDINGEEYDGGSYNLYDDGAIVNMATWDRKTGKSPVFGNWRKDNVSTIIKNLKKLKKTSPAYESVNEDCGCNQVNEIEYKDALDKFNKDLENNSQVKSIAKYYGKSPKQIVKALQSKIQVYRYNDKSIKRISIQYLDSKSQTPVHIVQTYKQNESVNEDGKLQGGGDDPCWKGYEMVGMKKGKGGKDVPNCVPKNESVNEAKDVPASKVKVGNKISISDKYKPNDVNHVFVVKTKDEKDGFITFKGTGGNDVLKVKKTSPVMVYESVNEAKSNFKVDDVVYNKKHKTIGIVRDVFDDGGGDLRTDADGVVPISDLEHYNPMKHKHQEKAKVAPSTKKEIDKRGLWKPFSVREQNINEESEYKTFFKKALEKTGKDKITSMSDEEKKAFFNKVDAAWKARGEKKESVNEASVNVKAIKEWRVSLYEGSYQFDQWVHKGDLKSAKKAAKDKLEKQWEYRKTNKSLWATFGYKKDKNPNLKDYQGWEEVFKERVVFEDGKFVKENVVMEMNPVMMAQIRRQTDAMMDKKITNPKTKEKVKVKTALANKNHPAHKQAKNIFQRIRAAMDRFDDKYGNKAVRGEDINEAQGNDNRMAQLHKILADKSFMAKASEADFVKRVMKDTNNYFKSSEWIIKQIYSDYKKNPKGWKYDDREYRLEESINEAFKPTDDTTMIFLSDKKYKKVPYFIKKVDSTHLKMSNSADGIDLVIPSHIAQHRIEAYYDDVRSWLKGGKKSSELFRKEYMN